LYVISAVGSALAWSWPSLMVFRLIGGLGIGASSVLGPVYIAELAPAKWRGRLVGAFQFNVVFGILVAYTSNYLIRTLHLGANGVALAGGCGRGAGGWIPGAAVRHSAQPAVVGIARIASTKRWKC
jgi:MFS family permease